MAWDWGQIIDLGVQLYGSYAEGQGAKDSARAQQQGSTAGIAEQRRQFDLIFGMLQPQYQVGTQALNDLSRTFGYEPAGSNALAPGNAPNPSTIGPGGVGVNGAGGIQQGAQLGQTTPGSAPSGYTSRMFPKPVYDRNGNLIPVPVGIDENFRASNEQRGRLAAIGLSPEERNYMQAYHDAYHKPSGVSQIAGAGLSLIGMANPVFGAALGAANASNANAPTGFSQGNGGTTGAGAGTGNALYQPPQGGPTGLANFQASPDYQFRRNEGMRGVENSFSAQGGARSGNALRALADFNSGLASTEFGNYFNRRAALAGIGQTATNQASSLAQNTGANVSNLLQQGANARASGIEGQTNALTSGLQGLLSWYNRNKKPTGTGDPYGGWT